MKNLILISIFCLFTAQVSAQGHSELAKGIEYERVRDYSLAAKFYKKAVKKGNKMATLHMARMAYVRGNHKDAYKLYEDAKGVESQFIPADYMNFWHAANVKGDKKLADSLYSVMVKRGILIRPKSVMKPDAGDMKILSKKQKGSSFFTTIYKDYIIYSTYLIDPDIQENRDKIVVPKAMNAKGEDFKIEQLGLPGLKSRNNVGPVYWYSEGKYLFITQNQFKGENNKLMFVYYFEQDGIWKGPFTPKFVTPDANYAYPTVTSDGDVVFASDRPGGFGGMDLYKVPFGKLANGKPENLGPAVNTRYHEVFPSSYGKLLFFSANGYQGFGGLDVLAFDGEKTYLLDESINSPYDDFGLTIVKDQFYLTSNRKSKGKEDEIWVGAWKSRNIKTKDNAEEDDGPQPINLTAEVDTASSTSESQTLDNSKNKALSGNAVVKLKSATKESKIKLNEVNISAVKKPAQSGEAETRIPLNLQCKALGAADSTFFVICGSFGDSANAIKMKNKVAALGFQSYILKHNKLNRVVATNATNRGQLASAQRKLESGGIQNFVLALPGSGTEQCLINLITQSVNPKQGDVVAFTVNHPAILNGVYHAKMEDVFQGNVELNLAEPTPGTNLNQVFNIQVIDFKPASADFLNESAIVELNKVLQILNANPNLKIMVEGHTDTRGEPAANLQISQLRAKACVNWLVAKGINASRISFKGFGEAKPLNRCKEGVNCSDLEHRENQRMEFIIIR